MQGVSWDNAVWYATVMIGVFGAVRALEAGSIDMALLWGSWLGFFAHLRIKERPKGVPESPRSET